MMFSKSTIALLVGLLILLLVPLLGAFECVRNLSARIIPDSDFWYGYMGYFGTLVLAIVAVWQTKRAHEQADKANEISKKIIDLELKSKIGYFEFCSINQQKEIALRNVGNDLIKICEILFNIKSSKNGIDSEETKQIEYHKDIVFVDKTIIINIPTKVETSDNENINKMLITMIIIMENSRGYRYKQAIYRNWLREDAYNPRIETKIMDLEDKLT